VNDIVHCHQLKEQGRIQDEDLGAFFVYRSSWLGHLGAFVVDRSTSWRSYQ